MGHPKTVAEATRQGYAGTDNSPFFCRFDFLTIRVLENCIFNISPMYEFSHGLGPYRTSRYVRCHVSSWG
jgi:hypothetical protein